jgi:hypothetical protein
MRATRLNRYGCKEGRSHRLRAGSSAGGGKSGRVGVSQQFNQRKPYKKFIYRSIGYSIQKITVLLLMEIKQNIEI